MASCVQHGDLHISQSGLAEAWSNQCSETLPSKSTTGENICTFIGVRIEWEWMDWLKYLINSSQNDSKAYFTTMEVFKLVLENVSNNRQVRGCNNFLTTFKVSKCFAINLFPFKNFLADWCFVLLQFFQTSGE